MLGYLLSFSLSSIKAKGSSSTMSAFNFVILLAL
jgi:hypothetical protein